MIQQSLIADPSANRFLPLGRLFVFALGLFASLSTFATAGTLLDTWKDGSSTKDAQFVENYKPTTQTEGSKENGGLVYQSLGMQFSAGDSNTLTDITV